MSDFVIENGVLKKYIGCDRIVVVPEGVERINETAFRGRRMIKRVILPEGLKQIDSCVFFHCKSLEEINLPQGLMSIGDECFYFCSKLTSITFPNSLTSIGDEAFLKCDGLESVEFKCSELTMGKNVFRSCNALKKIIFPKGFDMDVCWYKERFNWETIVEIAIDGWDKCTKVVDYLIHNPKEAIRILAKAKRFELVSRVLEWTEKIGLHTIDDLIDEMSECNSLEINSILLDYKMKSYTSKEIEDFENDKMEKALGIKEFTTSDYERIFKLQEENGEITISGYNETREKYVEIPSCIGDKRVTTIGECAFKGCEYLTSIKFSEGLKEIKDEAFRDCKGITSIRLPQSLENISQGVFFGCEGLVEIEVDDNNQVYTSIDGVLFTRDKKGLVLYPEGRGKSSYNVPLGTEYIEDKAFSHCREINTITLPTGLKSIRRASFICSNLCEINLPEGIKHIGTIAFLCCSSLSRIDLPSGITKINRGTFSYCSSLTSVTLPHTLEEIEKDGFSGCGNLPSIIIPKGVKKIGNNAFCECDNLTIYCEAEEKPEGWVESWNPDNRPVIWNYKGTN